MNNLISDSSLLALRILNREFSPIYEVAYNEKIAIIFSGDKQVIIPTAIFEELKKLFSCIMTTPKCSMI